MSTRPAQPLPDQANNHGADPCRVCLCLVSAQSCATILKVNDFGSRPNTGIASVFGGVGFDKFGFAVVLHATMRLPQQRPASGICGWVRLSTPGPARRGSGGSQYGQRLPWLAGIKGQLAHSRKRSVFSICSNRRGSAARGSFSGLCHGVSDGTKRTAAGSGEGHLLHAAKARRVCNRNGQLSGRPDDSRCPTARAAIPGQLTPQPFFCGKANHAKA
jgi:hypothetical protein